MNKPSSSLLALLTIFGSSGLLERNLDIPHVKPSEAKHCLVCSKLHNHNNSFCSVECCKKYKELKKKAR